MTQHIQGLTPHQKNFIEQFQRFTMRKQPWQVWQDFIHLMAIAISNRVDQNHFEEREKQYLDTIHRYEAKEREIFRELFSVVVDALETNAEQDFLGDLFMKLELGNHWKGQFFTPYTICRLMAGIQCSEMEGQIQQKGYITTNDPACGAGALLIAFANALRAKSINYQTQALMVAQDIDLTAALMCYIQLSLIGCAGYVIVGDTLSSPPTTNTKTDNVWYTPLYFSSVWHYRRLFHSLDNQQVDPKEEKAAFMNGEAEDRAIAIKAEQPLQLTFF